MPVGVGPSGAVGRPRVPGTRSIRSPTRRCSDSSTASRLTAYIGFDPTADSLHVGHLLQVLMLRRLQQAGHRPIALAGGGTGMIGDPGGKSEERTLLVGGRARRQPGRHPRPARALPRLRRRRPVGVAGAAARQRRLVRDGWPSSSSCGTWASTSRVNQMVAKESVRARLERPEQGISFTEFSYMLLQAYDFLHLFDAARLPAAARRQRPVGEHHHGHRAHPQDAPGRRSTG